MPFRMPRNGGIGGSAGKAGHAHPVDVFERPQGIPAGGRSALRPDKILRYGLKQDAQFLLAPALQFIS